MTTTTLTGEVGLADTRMPTWSEVGMYASARFMMLQGIAGIVWWLMIWLWPTCRPWFFYMDEAQLTLRSILLPDLLLFVLGSLTTSVMLYRQHPWACLFLAGVMGATSYATLYCLGISLLTGHAWLATVMMSATMGMTLACLWISHPRTSMPIIFRRTTCQSPQNAVFQATLQTVLFWFLFFLLLPRGLFLLEKHTGIPQFDTNRLQQTLAIVLFLLGACLGLSSSWLMASLGHGTPMPLACANRLVVVGPYRVVRNPMAIAGMMQGLAVGWWAGSPLIIIYVILGGLVWQTAVRPLEEHDLTLRFGQEYQAYRQRVSCWIPRLK
jgi:protein-S-isoprenylcysteine O-methyltransferase Ste14